MSDGMSDYWRNRRIHEQREKAVRDLIIFINCLIQGKQAPMKMLREIEAALEEITRKLNEDLK